MPLDAVAWAGWADRLAAYIETDAPLTLTPVVGGDPVVFIHLGRTNEPRIIEAGFLETDEILIGTRETLPEGGQFTFDSATWTVVRVERDRAGTPDWPFVSLLERHAV
jgi:hypothetical protein